MNFQRLYEEESLEKKIYDIVCKGQDHIEAIRKNNKYPYHYFLSPIRHNLFQWYPFKKEGSLLEIGAGYGQLTSLFTKKLDHVVAVEDTESKCDLISKRAEDATVLLFDFNDIQLEEKFDYIVICNIFEYAKSFVESENPYVDYLNYLKGFLKDDGVILLAISNRLGLKYFAGYKEEHTNQYFNGINGYEDIDYVQTFTKTEISDMINSAGFANYKFFYPYPSHEFPEVINTDEFVNKIPHTKLSGYSTERILFFDEIKLNLILSQENLSQYFANSFLVEIRSSDNDYMTDNIDFVKINANKKEELNIYTIIWSDDKVSKTPITPKANKHIKKMLDNSGYSFGKIKCLKAEMEGDSLYYDFLNEKTFEDLIIDAIIEKDREEFFKLIEEFHDALFYNSFESDEYATDEFLKIFKVKSDVTFHCHEKSNLDLIFNNLFLIDDEFIAIDYEFILDFPVPLEFIFIEVLYYQINHTDLINAYTNLEEIFEHFDMDLKNLNLFLTWRTNFFNHILNQPPYTHSKTMPFEDINKFDQMKKDIALKDKEIIKKNKEIKKKDKELKSLLNSNSWKITKPLRKFKSIFKKIDNKKCKNIKNIKKEKNKKF